MKKYSIEEHRQGLILIYKDQITESDKFMTVVLEEALRKLEETNIKPKKIEDWVVKLEKDFRSFKQFI